MKPPKMKIHEITVIKKACIAVASAETSCYPEAYDSSKSPLDGHCAAVATMLQGIFGGDIVTGRVKGITHYWNRIDGKEYDLTSCQFGGDGYFPLKKGRKVNRKGPVHPRFLLFANRVYKKLKTPKVGLELIMDEVISAWAKLNIAHGCLFQMIEKGWLKEDTDGSKQYFPKGGLKLLQSEMIEVYKHLEKCLIEHEKEKNDTQD